MPTNLMVSWCFIPIVPTKGERGGIAVSTRRHGDVSTVTSCRLLRQADPRVKKDLLALSTHKEVKRNLTEPCTLPFQRDERRVAARRLFARRWQLEQA